MHRSLHCSLAGHGYIYTRPTVLWQEWDWETRLLELVAFDPSERQKTPQEPIEKKHEYCTLCQIKALYSDFSEITVDDFADVRWFADFSEARPLYVIRKKPPRNPDSLMTVR